MYGTQTNRRETYSIYSFENDVKMYGTQTIPFLFPFIPLFENDVKMYGTQTESSVKLLTNRLRMM